MVCKVDYLVAEGLLDHLVEAVVESMLEFGLDLDQFLQFADVVENGGVAHGKPAEAGLRLEVPVFYHPI